MIQTANRSAKEVLDDHLKKSRTGSVEEDLDLNYAPDVVLLTGRGVYRGHEGARQLAQLLFEELPEAQFAYDNVLVEGEMGFLEWRGHGGDRQVDDGADSYLIRDGKIVVQTIHYTVRRARP
jgi:hypothetical protein